MEFKVFQKELEVQSRGWIPTFHDISKECPSAISSKTCPFRQVVNLCLSPPTTAQVDFATRQTNAVSKLWTACKCSTTKAQSPLPCGQTLPFNRTINNLAISSQRKTCCNAFEGIFVTRQTISLPNKTISLPN